MFWLGLLLGMAIMLGAHIVESIRFYRRFYDTNELSRYSRYVQRMRLKDADKNVKVGGTD